MKKSSFKEKVRYDFDNIMSRGIFSLLIPLTAASLIFILIMALLFWAFKIFPGKNMFQLVAISLMRTINAESINEASTNVLYFVLMLIIGIFSIFFISILIGLLTTAIESKIRVLRKGRSIIIERNHTVILGWSEMIFTVISELIEASNHTRKHCIAILGNKDKTEMEDLIKERVKRGRNVRIICRQGNPICIKDLKIVSTNTSSSIIILEKPDSNVIKAVLAVINSVEKERKEKSSTIVAALDDSINYEVAKIAARDREEFIHAKDFISKIIAQSSLQPGLSNVYEELMSFKGDEVYFINPAELGVVGKTFKETLFACGASIVMGVLDEEGNIYLNQKMGAKIAKEDKLITLRECEEKTKSNNSNNKYEIDYSLIDISKSDLNTEVKKILVLGWNDKIFNLVKELDKYLEKEEVLTVVADFEEIDDTLEEKLRGYAKNVKVKFLQKDIKNPDELEEIVRENYNHVVILANENKDMQEADAETIMILLHLRNIARKINLHFSLTTEVMHINNMELAKIARVDDFIISERLKSLFFVQLATDKQRHGVFNELLSEAGEEIYLKNVRNYIKTDKGVNFYTIIEAVSQRDEVAIGYKIKAEEKNKNNNFGVNLNPINKSKLINFSDQDSIIVISED